MIPFPEQRIKEMIKFVWGNSHSDMYRSHWRTHGIEEKPHLASQKDFETLPFLRREDLMQRPQPSKRLFVPMEEIEMLRSTSGTSGRGQLFVWRDHFPVDLYEPLVSDGAKRAMIFFVYHYFMSAALAGRSTGLEALCANPHDLKRSIRILVSSKADTLIITPSLALILSRYLEEFGYSNKITHILLWGEYSSDTTYNLLKRLYPNARFYFNYASAEANDTIGYASYRCKHENKYKHINTTDYFIEIIEGELVITSLRLPHAMPLIRYRTGDEAQYIQGSCECGDSNPRIYLGGRSQSDIVRIGGGEIRVEELDRVMSQFYPYIHPVFTAELQENILQNTQRTIAINLYIIKRPSVRVSDESLRNLIVKALLDEMRLSPTMSLKEAVQGGIFEQPKVAFVSDLEVNTKNPRLRLVSNENS